MILNHARKPVWDWSEGTECFCPACREKLVAKRPNNRVWHWAHRPYTSEQKGTCLHVETEWHLRWKFGYLEFPDWQIELPKKIGDRVFLLDAVNTKTRNVREFVHHMDDAYEARYAALMTAQNHQVLWMFDGATFASDRRDPTRCTRGFKNLLKPKAQALYDRIVAAKQNALVHLDDKLFKEWVKSEEGKEDVHTGTWYPCEGEKAVAVLANYNNVKLPYASGAKPAKSGKPKVNFSALKDMV